jgi:LPXTG-motif cell wall-anchored protein
MIPTPPVPTSTPEPTPQPPATVTPSVPTLPATGLDTDTGLVAAVLLVCLGVLLLALRRIT